MSWGLRGDIPRSLVLKCSLAVASALRCGGGGELEGEGGGSVAGTGWF